MTRVGTAFRTGVTELGRTPLLLALLVVAPAYVVGLFTVVAPDGPARVHVADQTVVTTLPEAFPAFTTPMTAALLSGIAGLFLMRTAVEADSRLVVAGYRPWQVVLARLGLVGAVSVVATTVSVAVMLTAFEPADLPVFLVGVLVTAFVYGLVGVLAGVLLDRLSGVYLILFGAMIDLFVFQNPLATDTPALSRFLPGHFPLRVAMAGGFDAAVATNVAAGTVAVIALLTTAVITAFALETRVE
ncbi:MAG: ABC transporter permease [Halobaculum sp.]